jgi:hypothetical protein
MGNKDIMKRTFEWIRDKQFPAELVEQYREFAGITEGRKGMNRRDG